MKRTLISVLLLVTACGQVTGETSVSHSAGLADSPDITDVVAAAEQICQEHVWIGIAEPATFTADAAHFAVELHLLDQAVRVACPETFYEPLSRAEMDWCGDGHGFGHNFFLVVSAGIDLGIESFSIVEPRLIARARNRKLSLSEYEVELLTAELQTMSESSRFERDWAAACRETL